MKERTILVIDAYEELALRGAEDEVVDLRG
jgi:hypothetical protein